MFRKAVVLILIPLFAVACATSDDDPNKRTKTGAAAGAVAGAVVGGVVGNQSGNNRTGAVVGAAAGAAIGAAIGRRMDQQQKELQQIPGVEVSRPAEDRIDVRLTSDILFDLDSAGLRPESRDMLRSLAENFQRYPDNVMVVEGHTDSSGSDDHNNRLSQRRADSVRDYLIDRGVRAANITARGFGEGSPKATNDTAEGRQLNRRVEIRIRGVA